MSLECIRLLWRGDFDLELIQTCSKRLFALWNLFLCFLQDLGHCGLLLPRFELCGKNVCKIRNQHSRFFVGARGLALQHAPDFNDDWEAFSILSIPNLCHEFTIFTMLFVGSKSILQRWSGRL